MKILELDLRAFGPFTDVRLDLAEGHEGMHILYGPNEAGKSSALRALKCLLYGIPKNSADNFIHENKALRIGGRLRNADGSEFAFLRRKGNKDTILSPDGKPIDERDLDRFLHGVTEESFGFLFGIDHEALVRGGRNILAGKGETGQSLFAAAPAGRTCAPCSKPSRPMRKPFSRTRGSSRPSTRPSAATRNSGRESPISRNRAGNGPKRRKSSARRWPSGTA